MPSVSSTLHTPTPNNMPEELLRRVEICVHMNACDESARKSFRFVNETDKMSFLSPQIGFGSNKKTRHLKPSGHKAFLVNNTRDVDLLLMHNRTYAAE